MKEDKLHFNIDIPKLIEEISGNKSMCYMSTVFRILQTKLGLIAGRASELNDAKLNILMLETKLYDVNHSDIQDLIDKERKRII